MSGQFGFTRPIKDNGSGGFGTAGMVGAFQSSILYGLIGRKLWYSSSPWLFKLSSIYDPRVPEFHRNPYAYCDLFSRH